MSKFGLRARWLAVALIAWAVLPASVDAQPLTPTALTCQVQTSDVQLMWTNAEAYDLIEVRRNGILIDTLPGNTTSYLDLGVPASFQIYHVHPVINQILGPGATCQVELQLPLDPPPLPSPASLKTVQVPLPSTLLDYVKDTDAAIRLGKALFWDMQAGSDGVTACATCHFHAGSDPRTQNILDPGPNGTFDVQWQNARLTLDDFPFHQLSDIADQNSPVVVSRDDNAGSQGVHRATFTDVLLGLEEELRVIEPDTTFQVGGLNLRQVTPRNAPSVINAIYMLETFWDGRASFWFNGRNNSGQRDPSAAVLQVQPDDSVLPVQILLDRASLASQSVGPPMGTREMSAHGRDFLRLGKKMLSLPPLQFQQVHANDSVLGGIANLNGAGLTTTYQQMIEDAFVNEWWESDRLFDASMTEIGQGVPNGTSEFTLTESNFSLFWGLALLMYQSTLVSDDSPYDRYQEGDTSALTPLEIEGLDVFTRSNCLLCHSTPVFSAAVTPKLTDPVSPEPLLERMPMQDALLAVYDGGYYNIGVRPTAEDLGRGALDPFGNPLSFVGLLQQGGSLPFAPGIELLDPPLQPSEEIAMNGAMKTPSLRNAQLTGPFFHNGSAATLEQVVAFYARGGNFATENSDDLAAEMRPLPFLLEDPARQEALVAFLESLTDERVRRERAPFDHPQLLIPAGAVGDTVAVEPASPGSLFARDRWMSVPAVGAEGRMVEGLDPLLEFLQPAPVEQLSCAIDPGVGVGLDWSNPQLPATIRVERDGVLIEVIPGASETYFDNFSTPGRHEYAILGADGTQLGMPRHCIAEIAPPAPANLLLEQLPGGVSMTWTNPFAYDAIDLLRDGVVIATLPADSTAFLATGSTPGLQEFAVVGRIEGVPSAPTALLFTALPTAVSSLTCVDSENTATLAWVNEGEYESLEIVREGELLATVAGTDTSFVDLAAPVGVVLYEIRAHVGGLDSLPSTCTLMFAPNPIPELLCVDDGGGGALSWVNGDLYETIEVHRDGVLLATLSGEAQGALDETLAAAGAGQFEYLVTPSVEGVAGSSTLCLLAIAPEPVSALTCSPLETGNQLTWQVSTPGDAIEILRDGALVALLGGEETAYLDPVTSIGDSLYEVRTVVDSLPSEGSACTVMRRPVPVSGLICDGGPGGITLSWTNEDVYNAVEVIRNGVVLVTLIGSLETFTDANPETGIMDYTVRALEAGLPSLDSPACQVSLAPGAVTDLICDVPDACATLDAQLSWSNAEPYDSIELFADGIFLSSVPGETTAIALSLPTSGSLTLSVVGMKEGLPSESADCAVFALDDLAPSPTTLVATPIGNCDVAASWIPQGPYSFLEVRVDGVLMELLPGSATSTTLTLPLGGAQTLCIVATTECGTELAPTCALVTCRSEFRRGDINADGTQDLTDTIFLLQAIFSEGAAPPCADAADANDDGLIDISDAIRALQFVFGFGEAGPLPLPSPTCGDDPTEDTLDCIDFPSCP